MKRLPLLLIAAVSLAGTAWAQQAPNFPPGAPPTGGSPIAITPDEWQELRAAHSAALQANPDLVAEHTKLLARMRTLEDKINAAMIKSDPTIAPIIARFEANRPRPTTPPATPPPAK